MNVMSGDHHGEMKKDNFTNPTLSYGVSKNYNCYQVEELIGSWREDDNNFHFRVSDWIKGDTNPRDFPIDSIKQLRELLESAPKEYNVK